MGPSFWLLIQNAIPRTMPRLLIGFRAYYQPMTGLTKLHEYRTNSYKLAKANLKVVSLDSSELAYLHLTHQQIFSLDIA